MNCNKAEELLVEYLYHELPAKKTVEIEKHLEVCDGCTRTLESWRTIHRGYQRTSEIPQPSPYLKQRILAVAKEELGRPVSLWHRLFALSKIAAIPIGIFILVMIFQLPWKEKSTEIAQEKELSSPEPAMAKQDLGRTEPASEPDVESRRRDAVLSEYESKSKGSSVPSDVKKLRADYEKNQIFKDETSADDQNRLNERQEQESGFAAPAAAPPTEATSDFREADSVQQNAMKEENRPAAPAKTAPQQMSEQAASSEVQDPFGQTQIELQNGNLEKAKRYAAQAATEDRSKSLAPEWHKGGIQSQNKGDFGGAILQLNVLVNNYQSYEGTPDALLRLGDAYAQIGRFDEARIVYERLSRYGSQQKVAQQRIQELKKKQQVQEQLKALGYVQQ